MTKLACLAALSLSAAPRAIAMHPRAESNDPNEVLRQLTAGFNDFRQRYDSRFSELEAAVNDRLLAASGSTLALGREGAHDPEYSQVFASYMRSGQREEDLRRANADGYRAQIQAAMSVGTNSDGGYLAPTEWDRQVRKALVSFSPMRRLATVITTGVGAFSTVWNDASWGSGWVGETAARPNTTTAGLDTLDFASGEIYANPAITQRLLDDSALDLEQWLANEIGDEFARQEGIAFVSGNGTNKPFGFLAYVTGGAADGRHPGGNLTLTTVAGAAAVTADELVAFAYSLPAPYRQGAVWLMNSTTAAAIAQLKDANDAYIWREAFAANQPATLLGYPVEIDEGMPNMGASAMPIAFGNFARGYLINDRLGTRVLRDPYTNKPYVNFYTTKRVGGGVLDPNAIRLLANAAA